MLPARILFVDDEIELERLIRQRLRKQIQDNEFEFVFAHNGCEALEILGQDHSIHLVLTDISMPEMDGLSLLEAIPKINESVKVIIVSAYGNLKNIRAAMNRDAFDFLIKPIDFEDLLVTVRKCLKSIQQLQDSQEKLNQARLQLIQAEKMASLGNLVAGVAHEINNPIGFLNGSINNGKDYVQDLLGHLALYQQHYPNPVSPIQDNAEDIDLEFLSEDLPKLLDSMKGACARIKGISTSLRTFSRADTDLKVGANLHDGLNSTLLILKYRLQANLYRPEIEVIRDYGQLPLVECFPGQLNQVFMNILANAIDVFDEAAQQATYDEIVAKSQRIIIQTLALPAENRVEIWIRDNGKGMTDEVKAKIFDHLFTTKAVGKGTGLGLTIARQIVVEKHGGSVEVQSALGRGTTFCTRLPISC